MSPMKKTKMTFSEVPLYNIFVTGPADTLFVKIANVSPRNAVFLNDRCPTWFPDNRVVYLLDEEHVLVTKNRWD